MININTPEGQRIMARACEEDWTNADLALVLRGEISESEAVERARVAKGAAQFLNLPIAAWPTVTPLWDYSDEKQYLCQDPPMTRERFEVHYPQNSLVTLCLPLAALKPALCEHSRRDPKDIWKIHGFKAARILFRWVKDCLPITPPLLKLHPNNDCIFIEGGNNRVAVADAAKVLNIPAYVPAPEAPEIISRVPGAALISQQILANPQLWGTACI